MTVVVIVVLTVVEVVVVVVVVVVERGGGGSNVVTLPTVKFFPWPLGYAKRERKYRSHYDTITTSRTDMKQTKF
jgi:hypothetical protein